jgi:putative hemolysin
VGASHIKALLHETREEGLLSSVQTDIVNRLISIPQLPVRSVMIPISKVRMVAEGCDRAGLLSKLREAPFTRWPVYRNSPSNIIGFINIYEVLSSREDVPDLAGFVKPMRTLPANTAVIDAIDIVQRENHKIVLVARGGRADQGKPIGIVTMKDLAEELLGELTEW